MDASYNWTLAEQRLLDRLTFGWYQAAASAMAINDPHFQLAQGMLGLQTMDDSGLFLMVDAVPADAAAAYYDPGSLTRRSQEYNALLHALQPEEAPGWGDGHEQALDLPLLKAVDAFCDPANRENINGQYYYRYSSTYQVVQDAVAHGGGVPEFSFDSNTILDDVQHSCSTLSTGSGLARFFDAAGVLFQPLIARVLQSHITVCGHIDHYAVLPVQPGAWFSFVEFNRALHNPTDPKVWKSLAGSGCWNQFFDAKRGTLARWVSHLLLVSGYELTFTYQADFTSQDLLQIQALWSLLNSPAASQVASPVATQLALDQTTLLTINPNHSFSVKYVLAPGKIRIWGVIVDTI